ncbi:MAG: ABC transporter permease [Bifidobacteriaceae bacterium]|jgi:peptide/nickel transport system permease protein|nr:ABC transporter permease [Bifidobacteriaceae bacterium]
MAKQRSSRGALARYLSIRFILIIPTVWILVTVVFFLMRITGNPIEAAQGGRLPPKLLQERIHAAGYDKPLLVQYWNYLWALIRHFDFGTTFSDHRQISQILLTNGAATLELVIYALIIAFLVGIPLGRLAARYHDKWGDVVIRIFSLLVYAAPVFFLGLLMKLLFTNVLGWLPSSGRASPDVQAAIEAGHTHTGFMLIDAIATGSMSNVVDVLKHAILPSVCLGLMTAGVFIRLVRINLLETLRTDFVTAARARGVKERRVVSKHAFRNALIPVVTVMGMQIALMLGGAILTETTFEWRGLGQVLANYIQARDFVAVQGIVTAIALVIAAISFLIDVINALVDPRVRY